MFTVSGGKLLARLAQSLESLAAHEGLWTGRRDGGPGRRLVRPDDGGQAPTAQAGAKASLRNRLRCLSFCMCSKRFAKYSPTVQAGGRQKGAKPSEQRQFAAKFRRSMHPQLANVIFGPLVLHPSLGTTVLA